jgi:hypothetical protein
MRVVLPTLRLDTLALGVSDRDLILATTLAATVTVPILDYREVSDGPIHGASSD